jgi:uncharacterized protein
MKIGVISDTHNFLDPRVFKLFEGVAHILHGGDIGLPHVLAELEQIAPVTAVSGNTDEPVFRYPLTKVVVLADRKFLLHHIVNPHALADTLCERFEEERPHVVVFGHTHKPFCETIDGTLYFNPGYAGKSRFSLPRSVGILHCEKKTLRSEFLAL